MLKSCRMLQGCLLARSDAAAKILQILQIYRTLLVPLRQIWRQLSPQTSAVTQLEPGWTFWSWQRASRCGCQSRLSDTNTANTANDTIWGHTLGPVIAQPSRNSFGFGRSSSVQTYETQKSRKVIFFVLQWDSATLTPGLVKKKLFADGFPLQQVSQIFGYTI